MEIRKLSDLTELIFNRLKEKFTSLHFILYPPITTLKRLSLPTVMLSLTSFEITRKFSNGQISADIEFSMNLIFKDTEENQSLMRDAAFVLCHYLNRFNFNHNQIGESQILSSEPDYFKPEVEGYLSWKIDFVVPFVAGDSDYDLNSVSPEVLINSNFNQI